MAAGESQYAPFPAVEHESILRIPSPELYPESMERWGDGINEPLPPGPIYHTFCLRIHGPLSQDEMALLEVGFSATRTRTLAPISTEDYTKQHELLRDHD